MTDKKEKRKTAQLESNPGLLLPPVAKLDVHDLGRLWVAPATCQKPLKVL